MSDEMLERFISSYIAASPGPVVSFVWHGGEPTLAGVDFYRRAVEMQKKHLPAGWQCWNNLQTNGVLLDDQWCSFLAANQFDVGLSIDGTPAIHDQYRPDPHNHGSYQSVAESITRLQSHGIQPDLLCTVTSTTTEDPLAAYRHLRDFNTGWIQFIPIVRRDSTGALTPDSVRGDAYGRFLCAIFDEWATHDLGRMDVQLFAELTRVLAGGGAGVCWMAPTCGQVLIVEADGSVYSCDHYVNPDHRLGSLTCDHLTDMVESATQRRFGQNKRDCLGERCRQCHWLALCNGGCPKDRTREGDNDLCDGLALFFAHAVPRLTQIIQMTRQGRTPTQIMARM